MSHTGASPYALRCPLRVYGEVECDSGTQVSLSMSHYKHHLLAESPDSTRPYMATVPLVQWGTRVEAQWRDGGRWTDGTSGTQTSGAQPTYFPGTALACDALGNLDVQFDENHGTALLAPSHPHTLRLLSTPQPNCADPTHCDQGMATDWTRSRVGGGEPSPTKRTDAPSTSL